jgi:hypothetical protein
VVLPCKRSDGSTVWRRYERTASMCAMIPIFLILESAVSDLAAAADICRFAKLNET